jgi:hypothetical protein
MILKTQKLWCWLWGWTWSETPLPSGIVVGLVKNRKAVLKAIYLRQDTTVYSTISWVDTRQSIWIPLSYVTWPGICRFYESHAPSDLPWDYSHDADYNAICYSVDGEVFSFPVNDIPEIDRLITEFPKPRV